MSDPISDLHSQQRRQRRVQRLLVGLLVAIPVFSLALNALSWLHYGIDLPFFDDWRGFAFGKIQSLGLKYLFGAVNDTMAPIGFALDALAQRYLNGNAVAYQFLSMVVVLGSLLMLQWKLLRKTLGHPLKAAACFVFALFMLQPNSYWGRENMAYHQALPLIFLLGALLVFLSGRMRLAAQMCWIFVLGLLAGFAYISGAFATLAAGLSLLALCWWGAPPQHKKALLFQAGALALAGAFSAAVQYTKAILPHAGSSHLSTAPLAMPYQSDFWMFFLGKVGRSLLLFDKEPEISLALVVLVCALCVFLLVKLLAAIKENQGDIRVFGFAAIYVGISAGVFTYLLLIAAGRTHLRPEEVESATQVFAFGFQRFHFFWATLLWPWVVAAILFAPGSQPVSRLRAAVAGGVVAAGISFMVWAGALGHSAAHQAEANARLPSIACLHAQLQKGEGVFCPQLIPGWFVDLPDFTPLYLHARSIGASFVRNFPLVPVPVGADFPPPLYRLTRDAPPQLVNIAQVADSSRSYLAGEDPQMVFNVGKPAKMAKCLVLGVEVVMRPGQLDAAAVFFRPMGSTAPPGSFSESFSQLRPFQAATPGKTTALSFMVESPDGFQDMLRFDPVGHPQKLEILELEVRCRLARRPLVPIAE